MKKLLLSIVCAFTLFALCAQVNENFSDYTVGGKLAQQAQAMGRAYWTTWSNAPGSDEDGVIAEMPAGNKVLHLNYGNDQLMWCGKKGVDIWELNFKIYIPTGKDAYFNILANLDGDQGDWALECFFARTRTNPNLTPGVGSFHAGKSAATTFNFSHDIWVPIKIIIDLDNDNAAYYVNDNQVYEWRYSLGNNGGGCQKIIDALNICSITSTAQSSFYIDDIKFFSNNNPAVTITTNVIPTGAGLVTGGGTYPVGTLVTLTAATDYDTYYEFLNWNTGSTENPLSFYATADATYTANFKLLNIEEDMLIINGFDIAYMIPISIIQKIKFIDNNLLVKTTDGNENSFPLDDIVSITLHTEVGIEELIDVIDVDIFINSFGEIVVESQLQIHKLTVIDLLGREMATSSKCKMNVNSLSTGIYILQVVTEKGLVNKKFIKN